MLRPALGEPGPVLTRGDAIPLDPTPSPWTWRTWSAPWAWGASRRSNRRRALPGQPARRLRAGRAALRGVAGPGARAPARIRLAFLAEAWLGRGDRGRARALAEESLAILREGRFDFWLELTKRRLGRIAWAEGAVADAESSLTQALEGFAAIGSRFEAARTRLDLADLEHARGHAAAATAHLVAARETFIALDVPYYVERADALAAPSAPGPGVPGTPPDRLRRS